MSAPVNLEIDQFAAFDKSYQYKINGSLVNLTGYTGKAQIRDSDDNLLAEIEVTLGGALGTIALHMDLAVVMELEDGKWDCTLTPSGGEPFVVMQGSATLLRGVTRPA